MKDTSDAHDGLPGYVPRYNAKSNAENGVGHAEGDHVVPYVLDPNRAPDVGLVRNGKGS